MLHAAHILCLVAPVPAAQKQALFLARRLGASLHAVPHPLCSGSTTDRDEFCARLTERAPEASTQVAFQVPEVLPYSMEAVRQYVADANIDLVITDSSSDREGVPPLAAEATQAPIERLDRPVFAVGHLEGPGAVHDLLVPTDLSTPALRAFRHAVGLARLYDAAIHVLHVVESIPYVALTPTDRLALGSKSLSEHRGQRRVREFLQEGEAADVPVHTHLTYGDAADQVRRFATENEVDLMVLSSHGRGHQSHAPLGQVAERVLGQTTCPLFLVRAFGTSLLGEARSSASGRNAE